jgi:porin
VAAEEPQTELRLASEEELDRRSGAEPWWQRDRLLGDLGGLRPWLGERGIELEIVSTDEGLGLADGGPARSETARYAGLTDLSIAVDTADAGWWDGGQLVALLQNARGRSLTEDRVGDLQTISNIDAPKLTQVSEYYLEQRVGTARLKVGRQDANADFVVADGAAELVSSSFGLVPTVPLPTYPAPALGVAAFVPLGSRVELGAGLWDGAAEVGSDAFETAFDGQGGEVAAAQLAVRTGGKTVLPGTYQLGVWHHSSVALDEDVAGAADPVTDAASGIYLIADQELWRRDGAVLHGFLQGGAGDGEATGIASYVGAGLTFEGFLPARPDDRIGIGFARAAVHDVPVEVAASSVQAPATSRTLRETVVEAYYAAPLLPWLVVKPDLQLVMDPGGDGDDALVLGVRFESRW